MLLFGFRHITRICTGEIKSEDYNAIGVRREVYTAKSVRRGTYEMKSVRNATWNLQLTATGLCTRVYLQCFAEARRRAKRSRGWWRSAESRVSTSTETESESTPRRTESRVNTSTGAESESTPRSTEVESTPRPERNPSQHLGVRGVESTPRQERNPSQHLGVRKSSQHLDRSGIRVNTSEYGSRVNTSTGAESESTPRDGSGSCSRVSSSSAWERNRSRLPKLAGLYTPERPMVRPGAACGARLFAR